MDSASDWVVSGGKGALDFDGVNDYVNIPDSDILSGLNYLTISFWVNPRTLPPASNNQRMWAVTKLNTGQIEWESSINANDATSIPFGKWVFTGYNPVAPFAARQRGTAANAVAGRWQHVVFTQSGRAALPNAYFDGLLSNGATLSQAGTPTAGNTTAPVQIGRRGDGAERTFDGLFDDIRIYRSVLSAADIWQLWQLGRGNMPIVRKRRYTEQAAGGFKAYWARRQSQLIGGGV
jgi:hypothetical protein